MTNISSEGMPISLMRQPLVLGLNGIPELDGRVDNPLDDLATLVILDGVDIRVQRDRETFLAMLVSHWKSLKFQRVNVGCPWSLRLDCRRQKLMASVYLLVMYHHGVTLVKGTIHNIVSVAIKHGTFLQSTTAR